MINNWKNKKRANHGAFWRQDVWAENNPEARRWEHLALPEKDSTLEALSTPQPGALPLPCLRMVSSQRKVTASMRLG